MSLEPSQFLNDYSQRTSINSSYKNVLPTFLTHINYFNIYMPIMESDPDNPVIVGLQILIIFTLLFRPLLRVVFKCPSFTVASATMTEILLALYLSYMDRDILIFVLLCA